MIKTKRKLILLLAALLPVAAIAQTSGSQTSQAPKWVTKTPVIKNTYIGIASSQKFIEEPQQEVKPEQSIFAVDLAKPAGKPAADYADSAKYKAFLKMTQLLPWGIEQESLLYELAGRGIQVTNIEDNLVKLMYDAPEFVCKGTWEDESEYWCYYSITNADFKTFLQRVTDRITREADSLYNIGNNFLDNGRIVNAAFFFSKALNTVQPLLFKCLPVDGLDLGTEILDALLTVYDGISIEPQFDTIPAVQGEALPAGVKVKVTQKGTPLQGIVVYSKFSGESTPATKTDAQGVSTLNITKVLDKAPIQTISFGIDENIMFDLETTVADKLFRSRTFPEAEVRLSLYDPAIFVKVEMTPYDSTLFKTVNDILLANRTDMKPASDSDKADLTVRINQQTGLQNSFNSDKYSINIYSSNLDISYITEPDGQETRLYDIQDFKYNTKSTRSEESAFHSTARRFSHILESVLPELVKGMEYDKREVVWRNYK